MELADATSSGHNNGGNRPSGAQERKIILSVIDVRFERNGRHPKVVLEVHDGEELDKCLAKLSQHELGTARVFDVVVSDYAYVRSDGYQAVIRHLVDKYPGLEHRTRFIENGFNGILENGFKETSRTADFANITLQWNQSALTDPDLDEYVLVSTVTESEPLEDGGRWDRESFLMCLNHGNDQLLAISITDPENKHLHRTSESAFDPWVNVLTTKSSFTAMGDGSRDTCAKLIMLDFYATSIYLQPGARLRRLFGSGHVMRTLTGALSGPRVDISDGYEALLIWYEELLQEMHHLTDAIDLLRGFLVPRSQEDTVPSNGNINRGQILMLQSICHQRLRSVQRSMKRLNREIEARDKVENIKESTSVKRLTILATIFLPLSLSASILSMQTRFVDLQLKLYDFLGVFVIVGSAAVLTLFLVRAVLKLKSAGAFKMFSPANSWARARTSGYREDKWGYRLESVLYAKFWISCWAVMVASFIVGMLKNVILGLKVLGYGFAGALGFLLLIYPLAQILEALYFEVRYKREERRKKGQRSADLAV